MTGFVGQGHKWQMTFSKSKYTAQLGDPINEQVTLMSSMFYML